MSIIRIAGLRSAPWRLPVLLGVLLTFSVSATSSGAGIVMEGGQVLGRGPNSSCVGMGGEVGNVVTLVGFIESLGPPFEDQMPDDRFEFTMVIHLPIRSLSSGGSLLFVSTDGTLELYKDMLKDADWMYPETFANGRRILTATLPFVELLEIWMPYSDNYGKILGTVTYTGGTLFDRVSENGVGESGEFGGLWYLVDPAFCPLNYFGSFDIAMTVGEDLPPIAVANTTWGRIKKVAR